MPGERNKAFVEQYDGAYKEKPGKYGAAGYNALNILIEAAARAGKAEPEAIRDALRKTDYAGAQRPLSLLPRRAKATASTWSWCRSSARSRRWWPKRPTEKP